MADDVRILVGRNVKRLRITAGLTQAALAERMGVDRAFVSGLEQGQRAPTVLTLWHITKALGVRPQAFFDEDKPRLRRAGAEESMQVLRRAAP
jgi:transcriptional regulator with XRE-family HTH domain